MLTADYQQKKDDEKITKLVYRRVVDCLCSICLHALQTVEMSQNFCLDSLRDDRLSASAYCLRINTFLNQQEYYQLVQSLGTHQNHKLYIFCFFNFVSLLPPTKPSALTAIDYCTNTFGQLTRL